MRIGLSGLVFVVFLVLKLMAIPPVGDWSWVWVTAPLWGTLLLHLVMSFIGVLIYAVCRAWRVPAVRHW
jgi:hypothetical protein